MFIAFFNFFKIKDFGNKNILTTRQISENENIFFMNYKRYNIEERKVDFDNIYE